MRPKAVSCVPKLSSRIRRDSLVSLMCFPVVIPETGLRKDINQLHQVNDKALHPGMPKVLGPAGVQQKRSCRT
jgi:hypothetical protein